MSRIAEQVQTSRGLTHVAAWCSIVAAVLLFLLAASEWADVKINDAVAEFEDLPVSDDYPVRTIVGCIAAGLIAIGGAVALWFGDTRLVKAGRLAVILINASVCVVMVIAYDVRLGIDGPAVLAMFSGAAVLAAAVSKPTEATGW